MIISLIYYFYCKNSEVYADHPEKRRKRGSLFFRKKKDKSKTKGQSTNCDGKCNYFFEGSIHTWLNNVTVACGAVINLATYKEHAIECKAKIAKVMWIVGFINN